MSHPSPSPEHQPDPRLNALAEKLDSARQKLSAAQDDPAEASEAREDMSLGLRAGTELVAAIAAGGGIGYALDRWLGTGPWLFISLLVLGVITGFVNVWRTNERIGHAVGYRGYTPKRHTDTAKESLGKSEKLP